jgi:hypothetical protein
MEILSALLGVAAGVSPWVALIPLGVVTASAALAAAVPQPKPGTALAVLRSVLDVLALNVGHARNQTSPA